MGQLARILEFTRTILSTGEHVSVVKCELSKNDITNAQNWVPPGDDSFPLLTDRVHVVRDTGTGQWVAIDYLDPINPPVAVKGEKRIYARDANTGLTIVEHHLKNTGESIILNAAMSFICTLAGLIQGANANGQFGLQPNGDFLVNGVNIKANGDITAPNSLVLNGKELDAHNHTINSGSSAPGPTGPNN